MRIRLLTSIFVFSTSFILAAEMNLKENWNDQLIEVLDQHDTVSARSLIEKGADINTRQSTFNQDTFLSYSVRKGKLSEVKWIIDFANKNGLDIDIHQLALGETLAWIAVKKCTLKKLHNEDYEDYYKILDLLIENEVDLNRCNEDKINRTCLWEAALRGDLRMLDFLIKNGANNVNELVLDKDVSSFNWTVIKIMLSRIVEVYQKKDDKESDEQIVLKLLELNKLKNYAIFYPSEEESIFASSTLLHLASSDQGSLPVVKWLVKNRCVDVNTLDSEKATPLHHAAFYGNLEIADYLIKSGADIFLEDKFGRTACCYARKRFTLLIDGFFRETSERNEFDMKIVISDTIKDFYGLSTSKEYRSMMEPFEKKFTKIMNSSQIQKKDLSLPPEVILLLIQFAWTG